MLLKSCGISVLYVFYITWIMVLNCEKINEKIHFKKRCSPVCYRSLCYAKEIVCINLRCSWRLFELLSKTVCVHILGDTIIHQKVQSVFGENPQVCHWISLSIWGIFVWGGKKSALKRTVYKKRRIISRIKRLLCVIKSLTVDQM